MANDGTDQATTKGRNLRYTYRNKDNEIEEKFSTESRSVIFTLDKSEEQMEFAASDLVKDQALLEQLASEAPMALMSMLFGLKTTTGNAITAVKSGNPQEMLEALNERKDTIVGGEWREGGQRGPSPKDVLEAMIAWRTAKKGQVPSEEWKEKARVTIKAQGTKQILLDKEILAEFEAIKLQRQQDKLSKLRAEAQAAQPQNEALAGLMD